jgi:hypothetical protein
MAHSFAYPLCSSQSMSLYDILILMFCSKATKSLDKKTISMELIGN